MRDLQSSQGPTIKSSCTVLTRVRSLEDKFQARKPALRGSIALQRSTHGTCFARGTSKPLVPSERQLHSLALASTQSYGREISLFCAVCSIGAVGNASSNYTRCFTALSENPLVSAQTVKAPSSSQSRVLIVATLSRSESLSRLEDLDGYSRKLS